MRDYVLRQQKGCRTEYSGAAAFSCRSVGILLISKRVVAAWKNPAAEHKLRDRVNKSYTSPFYARPFQVTP